MRLLATLGWIFAIIVALEAYAWAVEWDWRWLFAGGLVIAAAAGAAGRLAQR